MLLFPFILTEIHNPHPLNFFMAAVCVMVLQLITMIYVDIKTANHTT